MENKLIHIYPKQELLNKWAKDRLLLEADVNESPRCLRCGQPLRRNAQENALSRALDISVCPACGMDEALRDATGEILPVREWYAVQNSLLTKEDTPLAVLVPECSFSHIFKGPQKKFPLSNLDHPVSELAYSRSDYDGRRWWTTWFDCPDDRPDKQLAGKIDAFQTALMAMPEFQSLWHMKRMCRLYAARTSDPTEFNLYSETDQLYIWLRMITREKDYNLYVHFYEASRKDA